MEDLALLGTWNELRIQAANHHRTWSFLHIGKPTTYKVLKVDQNSQVYANIKLHGN